MASKKVSHRSKAQQQASKDARHDLAAQVATMAKRANQRLRELEKQGLQSPSHAYRYAERLAADGDRATGVDNKGRFKWNTNTRRQSFQDLQHEYAELDRFLNKAVTSTVKGTRNQYKKGYETYKSKVGEGSAVLSEAEYGDVWRMRNVKKIKELYGSEEVVKITEDAKASGISIDEIDKLLDTVGKDTTLTELYDMAGIDKWLDVDDDMDIF